MKKHRRFSIRLSDALRIVTACALTCIVSLAVQAQTENLKDVIGASNYGPTYTLQSWPVTDGTRRDVLNEGAQELLNMGSRVIRVILNANPVAFYYYTANPAYDVDGPAGLMSHAPEQRITETAKTQQYRDLFGKPFSTVRAHRGMQHSREDGSRRRAQAGVQPDRVICHCGARDC